MQLFRMYVALCEEQLTGMSASAVSKNFSKSFFLINYIIFFFKGC
jgi:hypothetical protein